MIDLRRRPHYSLAAARAYLDLLKGLVLKNWSEIGKPDGAALVGILREKWDADLKAARGTASAEAKKAQGQAEALRLLNAAHEKTARQLRLVNRERDELKVLLTMVAPYAWEAWLAEKRQAVVKIQAPGSVLVHLGDHENTCVYLPGTVPTTPAGACVTVATAGRTTCRCGRYRLERLFTDTPQAHEAHGD